MAATIPATDYDALDRLPAELRSTPQWVAVRLARKPDGRLEKVPVNIHTNGNASSTDPATWAPFDAARTYARTHRFAVGFILTRDAGIVGVDLDHVIDPDTGEMDPAAAAIVAALDTFAETSISGTGIHAFARATKPGTRCRTTRHDRAILRAVEIYDAGRMLCMTGNVIPGAARAIEDRQDAIGDLYREMFPEPVRLRPEIPAASITGDDQEILRRCRPIRDFETLYQGDTTPAGGDGSTADYLLCKKFIWAGATEDQADRLFRSSGLMRDKWEREDYRRRTIAAAFSHQTTRWTPGNHFGVSPATGGETPGNHFGVSGADDPAAAIAELSARLAAAERRVIQLETELARRDAIDRIAANGTLGASRRGAAEAMNVIARMVDRNTGAALPNGPDGAYVLNPYTLGGRAGMTPRTFRAQLETVGTIPLPDAVRERHNLPEETPAWSYQERKRPHPDMPGKHFVDVLIVPAIPVAELIETLAGEAFDAPRPGPVGARTPVLIEQELIVRQTRRNADTGEAVGARLARMRGPDGEPVRLAMDATSLDIVNEDGELIRARWQSFAPAPDDAEFELAERAAEIISAAPGGDGDVGVQERDTELGGNFGDVSGVLPLLLPLIEADDDRGEAGADRWTA